MTQGEESLLGKKAARKRRASLRFFLSVEHFSAIEGSFLNASRSTVRLMVTTTVSVQACQPPKTASERRTSNGSRESVLIVVDFS